MTHPVDKPKTAKKTPEKKAAITKPEPAAPTAADAVNAATAGARAAPASVSASARARGTGGAGGGTGGGGGPAPGPGGRPLRRRQLPLPVLSPDDLGQDHGQLVPVPRRSRRRGNAPDRGLLPHLQERPDLGYPHQRLERRRVVRPLRPPGDRGLETVRSAAQRIRRTVPGNHSRLRACQMTHTKFGALLVLLAASGAFAQQEVVMKISEGMPMISLALPEFIVRRDRRRPRRPRRDPPGPVGRHQLHPDLPAPAQELLRLRRAPGDLDKIFFKDWDSVQARLLVTGEVREDGGRIVFDGKIYDVKSERFIVGKRYQAEKNGLRLVAHKMADELLKLHGEKPLFTTKIGFVSNRDGNDEIYMMDYDGANPTRMTFNKIKDYMPAWSPDQRTIAFTSYRGGNAGLYLRNIYEGKETPLATKGTSYSAAFSPDGKKLAFCSTMAEEGNADIFVMDLETKKIKRLTFNAAIETAPSWSPTGREIAFTTDRLGPGPPRSTSWTPRAPTSARPASAATTTTRRPGPRRASGSPSSPGSTTPSTSTSSTSGPTRSPSSPRTTSATSRRAGRPTAATSSSPRTSRARSRSTASTTTGPTSGG